MWKGCLTQTLLSASNYCDMYDRLKWVWLLASAAMPDFFAVMLKLCLMPLPCYYLLPKIFPHNHNSSREGACLVYEWVYMVPGAEQSSSELSGGRVRPAFLAPPSHVRSG